MAPRSDVPRPPSVERVLAAVKRRFAGERHPAHDALVLVTRAVIERERANLAAGVPPRDLEALAGDVQSLLQSYVEPPLGSVINATGVIVHTNLGRAPWAAAAIRAAEAAASGYLLLEMDRRTGRRGARFREAEAHLIALTGAGDALVVNNNAAAVALAVGLAGRGGGVAVSRGELMEIGGGVRIPEIVRRAGARLVEVGTTNRTRANDFEEAFARGRVRVALRVHPSNFRQSGFTEAPDARQLAALAHEHGAVVVDDLGSGALLDTEAFGLTHEPMPSEALAAGADLVTFSGDKLLGGPQAGLVVGRADLVARLRRDPLARAMRPDKVTLAALAATLGLYRAGTATTEIPVWRMIATPVGQLKVRAEALAGAVASARGSVSAGAANAPGFGGVTIAPVELEATVGGGSLPGEVLPSWGVSIRVRSVTTLLARLRTGEPAVVGRVANGAVVLDLRTVDPADDEALRRATITALGAGAAVAGDHPDGEAPEARGA